MSQVTMDHMSEETAARLAKIFGEPAVDRDTKSAIFNHSDRPFRAPDVQAISRETKQIVEVSIHAPGETATIGDRTYVFGEDGKWHRQRAAS